MCSEDSFILLDSENNDQISSKNGVDCQSMLKLESEQVNEKFALINDESCNLDDCIECAFQEYEYFDPFSKHDEEKDKEFCEKIFISKYL